MNEVTNPPPRSADVLPYAEPIPAQRLPVNARAENCFALGLLYPVIALTLVAVTVGVAAAMTRLLGVPGALVVLVPAGGMALVLPVSGLRMGIVAIREMRGEPARNRASAIAGLA